MGYLIPKQIVEELDKYIIGQHKAKRAVAIALRTRWRRQQLSADLRDEVMPKNIIMIGPTGVGKSEIARRLARLVDAPFLKVEASKYTEVGYVGRDVESMVRDITDIAVNLIRTEKTEGVQEKAKILAEERLLDILFPMPPRFEPQAVQEGAAAVHEPTREKLRKQIKDGSMNDRYIELELKDKTMPVGVISNIGMEDLEINLKEMLGGMFPGKKKNRKVKVPEALDILMQEEAQKLIDMDEVVKEATLRVEQSGIIFIDEIDKVAGRESRGGPDVSREGVQRDLLPIVEGSAVKTRYGIVKTDHVLFIAAGAFHISKPSDLIPELQGRFPIRVELDSLGKGEFIRILTEPKNALIKQYIALLETEGVKTEFTKEGIEEIAAIAEIVNERTENIGARRLHTVMERLLDEISFNAPEHKGKKIVIDADYVKEQLGDIIKSEDLSRYIL